MKRRILAFDLGGTRLKAGVVSGDGATWVVGPVKVVASSPDVLDAMRSISAELAGNCDTAGLCVPGVVVNGVLESLPGKLAGLEGTDLARWLEDVTGRRGTVVNDALAYAWGEAKPGRTVVVTIGTGVGVGVVDERAGVATGPFDGGVLGGQIPISEGQAGETDTSGRTGTIEALCRADRLADCTVEQYRCRLTTALVALAHAHGPETIVVGGGGMPTGSPVFDGLEAAVNARLFGSYRVRVHPARNGDAAALIGLARIGAAL